MSKQSENNAKTGIYEGVYEANQRGFGFVRPDGDYDFTVFIPKQHVNGALHKDRVICRLARGQMRDGRSHPEGEVVNVLEKEPKRIVGTVFKRRKMCVVHPDDERHLPLIRLSAKEAKAVRDGDKAMVLAAREPDATILEGKVLSVLGKAGDPGVDVACMVASSGIPFAFPEEALLEADKIPQEVPPSEASKRRRVLGQIITIDGEDTKDVDDAVSLEENSRGNLVLGVHIADVAHYVKEGSALDREALRRGTSVYLADRVIPMLPVPLSNGICSLNEGVDRLALSCFMELDGKGNAISSEIAETVIKVGKRMSYKRVGQALNGEPLDYLEYVPMLERMEGLCAVLKQKRVDRGALFFDTPEAKIILDETGKPVDIVVEDRGIASEIIEEFMLVCNETVAKRYSELEAPFVYRVHEEPDKEKITKLRQIVDFFGYKLGKGDDVSAAIQALLAKSLETPEEAIIARLTLRSFMRAKYSPDNEGHFGLAADNYCHFTSPIRRYPDLQIHRIIKEHLHGMRPERKALLKNLIKDVASSCSKTERTAEELEREVAKLKKAEYMKEHEGEAFIGVVTGVEEYGIYVELPNTVDGLVHNRQFWSYDLAGGGAALINSNRKVKLGQMVDIIVASVNVAGRQIDFKLVSDKAQEQKKSQPKSQLKSQLKGKPQRKPAEKARSKEEPKNRTKKEKAPKQRKKPMTQKAPKPRPSKAKKRRVKESGQTHETNTSR
jgi:ribonuclease R